MVFPLDYIYPEGVPAKPTTRAPKSSGGGYYSSGAAPEHSGYYSNSQAPLHRVYPRGTHEHAPCPQGVSNSDRVTIELRRKSSSSDIFSSAQRPRPHSPSSGHRGATQGPSRSSTTTQARSVPDPVFVRPYELSSFRPMCVKERVAQSPFSRGSGTDYGSLSIKEYVARSPFSSAPAAGPNQQHDYRPTAIKERVARSPFSADPAPAPRSINPGQNNGTSVSHESRNLSRKSSFSKLCIPEDLVKNRTHMHGIPYAPHSTTSSMQTECGSCASPPRPSQQRSSRTDPRCPTQSPDHGHKQPPSGPSGAAVKLTRKPSFVSSSLRPPTEPPHGGSSGGSTLPRQPSIGMLRVPAEYSRAGSSVIPLSSRISVASLRPSPDHTRSSGGTLSRQKSMSSLPRPTGMGGCGNTLSRQRSMGALIGTSKPTQKLKSALKDPSRRGTDIPKKVSFSDYRSTWYFPRHRDED